MIKGPFRWFLDAGKAYVLQDAALVGRVRTAWEPSRRIGAQMSALGNQMGELGRQQEKIVKSADRITRQLIAQAVSEGKARPVQ